MKLKVNLEIETNCEELEIDETELEGKTAEEIDEYFFQKTREWAEERINFTWEVIKEEKGGDDD